MIFSSDCGTEHLAHGKWKQLRSAVLKTQSTPRRLRRVSDLTWLYIPGVEGRTVLGNLADEHSPRLVADHVEAETDVITLCAQKTHGHRDRTGIAGYIFRS